MKKYGVPIVNGLLLIFGTLGLGFTIFGGGFMNTGTFRYYTVQSNLLAMLTAAVTLFFWLRCRNGRALPAAAERLRLTSTVAITLTFLVFSVMLTPKMIADGQGAYLTSPGNLFVHNLVPICAILDWCLFASTKKLKTAEALYGLLPAFVYLCFVHLCVTLGLDFSGNTVPYFFFDYQAYGWLDITSDGLGVIYWIAILAAVLLGLGFAFLGIARRRERRAEVRAEKAEKAA